jgi:hypothetical protein
MLWNFQSFADLGYAQGFMLQRFHLFPFSRASRSAVLIGRVFLNFNFHLNYCNACATHRN